MGEVGRHCSQAWLSMQRDGLKKSFVKMRRGWFGLETYPFRAISRKYQLVHSGTKWPLGDTKLFWAFCFSPDPALSVVRPRVTQSLSCSYFVCNKNTTAVPERKRKRNGQKEHSASLKDEESVFWHFVDGRCDLIIYFFSHFPVRGVSKQLQLTRVNIHYAHVQRNSCGKRCTIVHCPHTLTPHDRTVFLVTCPLIFQYG